VPLRDILGSREYQVARSKSKLVFALGKDVAGRAQSCDIARAPHLLIAGATGSGKSMLLNTLIASLLTQATPEDVRLLMIDPKLVELGLYNGIPHLLRPVVTKVEQAVSLLDNAIAEMERRYQFFLQASVRNLEGYRKVLMEKRAQGDTTLPNLPAIVIIIDELADLMMMASKEENVEEKICRLAQKARATGIHLVIATQRPSVDVITGLIKANIPTRIALTVAANQDSRTILDRSGAEKLLGRGDMLYLPSDASEPMRIQGAFMTDKDATHLVAYWQVAKSITTGHETWADESEVVPDGDETLEQQLEASKEKREVPDSTAKGVEKDGDELLLAKIIAEVLPVREMLSTTFIQQEYSIGYPRAARLIRELERRGFISAPEGGRNERRVLTSTPPQQEQEALTDGV
jgi:DNA segregation ATPase FtsK/SpoIIIE-like protein